MSDFNSLSADTQAVLLLCAQFGVKNQDNLKSLTLKEYNLLTQLLQQQQLRPGDLLNRDLIHGLNSHLNANLDPERIQALLNRGALLALKVEEWTNQGLWILSRGDDDYPQRLKLKLRYQAPPLLYGIGNLELLKSGGLAIVGSRNIEQEEVDYTAHVGQLCSKYGITIVSGGAKGVDQAAMLSAIEAEGTSIGVVANDLAKFATTKHYRDAIRENQLVLISPYDPQARFQVGNAMGRNKLIYALADQALVVCAAYQSGGTWAGAVEELKREQACPLWVRVSEATPLGNQGLLDLGAKPLLAEDISQCLFASAQDSQPIAHIPIEKVETTSLPSLSNINDRNYPLEDQGQDQVAEKVTVQLSLNFSN
ncbi:MAG: DNA-processing protein DprA [Cyanobacteriota bacterium]|nr:DNA-processing protein DprA [Cyanobacteriota bacterium]